MMFKALFALAAFAAASASAQQVVPPSPPAAPVAPAAPSAPAVAVKVVPASAPAPVQVEKIICKTSLETGSLVKKNKVCLTKKQWVYVNNESEAAARKIVDDNSGRPTSN